MPPETSTVIPNPSEPIPPVSIPGILETDNGTGFPATSITGDICCKDCQIWLYCNIKLYPIAEGYDHLRTFGTNPLTNNSA